MQLPLFGLPSLPARPDDTPAARESDPLLRAIWLHLRTHYFPERPDLDEYQLVWSARRQKRTLASCSVDVRKVRVARELNVAAHAGWLDPLLYHEMCHAFLGPTKGGYHGPAFKALERQHPLTSALDGWIKAGGWLSAVRSDRARRRRRGG